MRSKRTTPTVAASLPTVLITLLLVGCNFFVSKEDECLISSRLSFNDPDSLKVVQNLGDRGKKAWLVGDGFWLRYSVANAVGGRISSNMACEKVSGKWSRSVNTEETAKQHLFGTFQVQVIKAETVLLEKNTAEIKACKTIECVANLHTKSGYPLDPTGEATSEMVFTRAEKRANELAYEKVYLDPSNF